MVNILKRKMTEIGGKVRPASREQCPNRSDCACFRNCRVGCSPQCPRCDLHRQRQDRQAFLLCIWPH